MVKKRNWATLYLLLPSLGMTVLFVLVPVVMAVIFSFLELVNYRFTPNFTLENWIDVFSGGAAGVTIGTMIKTLGVVGLVIGLVIAGAYPVAYLLAWRIKSQVTQTVILVLCILPYWTSYIIRMITWVPLLAEHGLVNMILMKLGIIDQPITTLLFSFKAMILVEFFLWIVFMIGPIFWFIARIPSEVMEASLNLGATRLKRFLTITLPLSVPGIATGILFIFIMIMSDFATPRIIGGGHIFFFASYVYSNMSFSEYAAASVYSVLLMGVVLAIVYLLFRLVDLRKEL